jgi:Rhodopirellula transposase DDE domain
LFSRISTNWRGRPLTSHEVVVNTIGSTATRTGLTVHAELDPGAYPTGVTVAEEVMAALPLTAHDWHGAWNYTLRPEPPAPAPVPRFEDRTQPDDRAPAWLHHPTLTGMSTPGSPACWPRSSSTSSTTPRSACTTSTLASASCAAGPCRCRTGCWSPSSITAGRPSTKPSPPCSARLAPPPGTPFTR